MAVEVPIPQGLLNKPLSISGTEEDVLDQGVTRLSDEGLEWLAAADKLAGELEADTFDFELTEFTRGVMPKVGIVDSTEQKLTLSFDADDVGDLIGSSTGGGNGAGVITPGKNLIGDDVGVLAMQTFYDALIGDDVGVLSVRYDPTNNEYDLFLMG